MNKQRFNPEEYANLKHRIEALQSRVQLDVGPEQENAKRLLAKVVKKLKVYETTHEIPEQQTDDYNTTVDFEYSFVNEREDRGSSKFEGDKNYFEDTRSEAEMISDLGILYAIFGSTYQTTLNYHVYKIKFKKQAKIDDEFGSIFNKACAFYQVYADIYEDDIRICTDVIIGFWPYNSGDDRCGDMEFACMDNSSIEKYNGGYAGFYVTLINGLKDMWNFYFDNQNYLPMLTGSVLGYLGSDSSSDKLNVQLNKEQRKEIIDKTESEIISGKMKYLESIASKFTIMEYKVYNSLQEILEESGVIYKVEPSGVYISEFGKSDFKKLVGYEKCKTIRGYCFYLL